MVAAALGGVGARAADGGEGVNGVETGAGVAEGGRGVVDGAQLREGGLGVGLVEPGDEVRGGEIGGFDALGEEGVEGGVGGRDNREHPRIVRIVCGMSIGF
jgi:hypothetical protein